MSDEKHNHEEDDDGSLRIKGPGGMGLSLPRHLVEGITKQFAKWVVPAVAVLMVLWGFGTMVAQIVDAWRRQQ